MSSARYINFENDIFEHCEIYDATMLNAFLFLEKRCLLLNSFVIVKSFSFLFLS